MRSFDPRELGRQWRRRPEGEERKEEAAPSCSPLEAAALLFEVGRFGFRVFQARQQEWQHVEHAVLRLADERLGCLTALDVVSALEVPLGRVRTCLERFESEGHCRREAGDVYVFDRFLARFCEYCGEPLSRERRLAARGACEGCGAHGRE